MAKPLDDAVLLGAVGAALKAGKIERPEGVDDPDWGVMRDFLEEQCLPIRAEEKPWDAEGDPITVGGRVYQDSNANQWCSYDAAARTATRVSDYQWRSPSEWFSELFAITWLNKVKPPSAVSAAVAKYLWQPR
jgi:hypothetical protein